MIISDNINISKFQPGQLRETQTNRPNEAGNRNAKPLKLVSGGITSEVKTAGQKGSTSPISTPLMQEEDASDYTKQGLEKLEKTLSEIKHNKLEFSIHEETGRTVVKIIDQDTGKVIKQLPPEELLDLAAKLEEMSGVLFDKKI